MFIYKNDGVNSNVLDFQIKKGYDVIAFASTPKETCLPSCTLYTSRIIELKIGDLLSITSHYKGIQVYMECSKAQFGLSMLEKNI